MVTSGKLVNTLLLLGVSSVLSIIIGVFLGVIAARKRGGIFDNISVTSSLTTFSLPTFWMGLVLILIFSYWLGWFPSGGVQPESWGKAGATPSSIWAQIPTPLSYLFLPALILTLFFYRGYLFLTKGTTLRSLRNEYF